MADTPEAVLAAAQELKGKNVRVTLGPNLTVTGKLVKPLEGSSDEGVGVMLQLPEGTPFRAWPLLAIEGVQDDPA